MWTVYSKYFLLGIIFYCCIGVQSVRGQKEYKIHGVIEDSNGDPLELANIIVDQNSNGAVTDEKGQFTLYVKEGNHTLYTTYVGYQNGEIQISVKGDTSIVFSLSRDDKVLSEVKIVEYKNDSRDIVNSSQSSAVYLDKKDIEMVPSIAGENDIIKVVQLLPGVNKGIEGTGDFYVRGGDADQNLLLLDGATIYNTGHLFGFISVFNPGVIGNATIMKGAFPSEYGGRLSSILDVRTQSSINDKTTGEGSVGLISSNFSLKTPIKKNKLGLMLSARRTYIDQVVKSLNNGLELPYYFYDLNGRMDYVINDKSSMYISSYYGADVLKFSGARDEGEDDVFLSNNNIYNNSQSLGWNYRPNNKTKIRVDAHRSLFRYDILNSFNEERITANSGIEDYGLQLNIKRDLNRKTSLSFGAASIMHRVDAIEFNTDGIIASILPSSRSEGSNITEAAIYGELSHDLTDLLQIRVGYRQSFGFVDGIVQPGFEPRLAARYLLNETSSLKLSFSRMSQYLHRVSSSSITLPVDFWYSSTSNIKPQASNQYTIGYAYKHQNSDITFESDVYYKEMFNITEYEAGTTLLFNAEFEDALLQGRGESYGFEFLVRKEGEKLYGWLSYSLGWSYRTFDQLNEGRAFNATYDRRHNASIVVQYNIYKRWAVSGVWEFISGSRFTPVIGQYAVVNPVNTGIDLINIYSDRNDVALSNSHRLDLMVILKSKEKRRFQGEWRGGVYNVYNRATPVQMYVADDGSGNLQYIQPGLFGTLPFISYHFKF